MRLVADSKPGEGIQESAEENLSSDQNRRHTAEKAPLKDIAKSSVSCDSGICMNLDTFKEEIGRKIDSMITAKFNEKWVEKMRL